MTSHWSNQRVSILRYCRTVTMIYPFRLKRNNQDGYFPTHIDLSIMMPLDEPADYQQCSILKKSVQYFVIDCVSKVYFALKKLQRASGITRLVGFMKSKILEILNVIESHVFSEIGPLSSLLCNWHFRLNFELSFTSSTKDQHWKFRCDEF